METEPVVRVLGAVTETVAAVVDAFPDRLLEVTGRVVGRPLIGGRDLGPLSAMVLGSLVWLAVGAVAARFVFA